MKEQLANLSLPKATISLEESTTYFFTNTELTNLYNF